MLALYVLVGLVAAVLVWIVWTYNTLIRHRNLVSEAWSGIDVQLTRRHELVPNLIRVAEAYRVHETRVLTDAAKYRSESMKTESPARKGAAETKLSGALAEIFAVAENYPDLKAADVYLNLQSELTEVEDVLQMARRYYNGTVRNYNNIVEVFPMNLIAGGFRFPLAEFFQAEEDARAAPRLANA